MSFSKNQYYEGMDGDFSNFSHSQKEEFDAATEEHWTYEGQDFWDYYGPSRKYDDGEDHGHNAS